MNTLEKWTTFFLLLWTLDSSPFVPVQNKNNKNLLPHTTFFFCPLQNHVSSKWILEMTKLPNSFVVTFEVIREKYLYKTNSEVFLLNKKSLFSRSNIISFICCYMYTHHTQIVLCFLSASMSFSLQETTHYHIKENNKEGLNF